MATQLKALQDAIQTTAAEAMATIATLRARAEAGALDAATLRHIDTELSGYQDDIDEIRAILDSQDATGALSIERADLYLGVWRWERSNRFQLIRLRKSVTDARAVAKKLLEGTALKVHVVRSGETLQSIAQRELGDWRNWNRILDANPDIDPGAPLSTGTHLKIPRLR